MAVGARGFLHFASVPRDADVRKLLHSLGLVIREQMPNSIGGDIIPPFCALDRMCGAGILDERGFSIRQNETRYCWLLSIQDVSPQRARRTKSGWNKV